MENNNKLNKNLKRLFTLILLIFIFLYVFNKTGYYDANVSKKTILTKEAIIKFEKDLNEGKDVSIENYIDTSVNNYNNIYSSIGLKISDSIDYLFNEGSIYILKLIKTLFS